MVGVQLTVSNAGRSPVRRVWEETVVCRFALYMGPPITLDLLTTKPAYSIVRQSFKARMREEPLNGDGFGLAWYVPEISPVPALFRSIQPAWNNVNLLHLARVSVSPVVLAHVRAATGGFSVSEANCHPFIADRFAFMHNGSVAEFQRIKRRMREDLSDESYLWIHGTTDSEHLFARFRDHVKNREGGDPAEAMAAAVEDTIHDVKRMTEEVGATRRSLLNLAVCDGERAVVSRYATLGEKAPTLYYCTGGRFACVGEDCEMSDAHDGAETVIVASEPVTRGSNWRAVPLNHLLVVHKSHRLELRAIA
jgi:predicted glutamine amidotransferase